MCRFVRSLSLCAAWLPLAAAPAVAHLVSTTSDEIIDGKYFFAGDLFAAQNTAGNSGLYLSAAIFDEDGVDVNAAALLPNGHLLLSVGNDSGAALAGLHVDDGDLVEYDPATGSAALVLDESVFGVNVDIDAVEALPNGHLLLSLRRDDVIAGTLFHDGDVIEYDPATGGFSLFLSESLVGGADIDAFAIRANGHYLLSTRDMATIGALTFTDDTVVDYDPGTGATFVVLRLDSRTSGGGSNVDAIIDGGPLPCSDGLDNDGDGLTDFPNDPGCTAAGDYSETGTAPCDDGADNDGDGSIDFPGDPICTSIASPTEYGICQDGNDNDHDGSIDFDGGLSVHGAAIAPADATCQGNPARKEHVGAGACGLGFEAGLLLPVIFAIRAARRRAARG